MTHQTTQPLGELADPATPIARIARTIRDHQIAAVPVQQDGRLVGMVTERDIVSRLAENGGDLSGATAREALSAQRLCRNGTGSSRPRAGEALPEETFVAAYLEFHG